MMMTPKITLLDRYVLKQLIEFFMLGVVIFTLIAFFSDAFLNFIQDVQKLGISIETAMTLLGLQLPRMIALVLPASSFLAVLMVFNNLNNTFEIIAMRMNGISLSRLMMPAILLGLFSTVMAYVLGDYVVPFCNTQTNILKEQAFKAGRPPTSDKSFTFKDYDENHRLRQLIYVGKSGAKSLESCTIIDLKNDNVMQIVQSKSGRWFPDRWEFYNANSYTVPKKGDSLVFTHFQDFYVSNLISNSKNAEAEAEEKRRKAEGLGVDTETQPFLTVLNIIQKREALGKKVKDGTYIRLWEKLTLPLSCLFIIITAVPLAITPPRQGSNRGFVYALAVLFAFYIIRAIFVSVGKSDLLTLGGVIPTPYALLIASWMPLIVIALFGSTLLIRKSKVL